MQDLSTRVYGNPHSQHAQLSGSTVDTQAQARQLTLDMCSASPAEYECIFTSGATGDFALVCCHGSLCRHHWPSPNSRALDRCVTRAHDMLCRRDQADCRYLPMVATQLLCLHTGQPYQCAGSSGGGPASWRVCGCRRCPPRPTWYDPCRQILKYFMQCAATPEMDKDTVL